MTSRKQTRSSKQVEGSTKSNKTGFQGADTMKSENKAGVAEIITNIIIERLESGCIPWQKPWSGAQHAPRNFITGKTYRGINAFLLANVGYASPYFLTFKQVQDKGGQVIKGAQGFPVVFWSMVGVEDAVTGDEKNIPFMRYYRVFNIEQTTLEVPVMDGEEIREFNPIEAAEAIIAAMPQRPEIKHGQNRAFYSPSLDYINLPKKELFVNSAHYFNTAFHELSHATGHSSRVGRKGVTESNYFGSHEYSKEELVAEMGAAFLMAEAGIVQETIDNSAAYIKSWISALKSKDNKGLVIQAAGQAQKAVDFILDRKQAEEMKKAA